MARWYTLSMLFGFAAVAQAASEKQCENGATDLEGACLAERNAPSLMQKRFQTSESAVDVQETNKIHIAASGERLRDTKQAPPTMPLPDWHPDIHRCEDGVGIADLGLPDASNPLQKQQYCWYLSKTGADCDDTCSARGMTYSFAAPVSDMTPKLVGHIPKFKQTPWLFVECYVPDEDRYHPYSPSAVRQGGARSYPSCQLACPCSGSASTPMPYNPAVPYHPARPSGPYNPAVPYDPAVPVAITPGAKSCVGGVFKNGRCWFLSDLGDSCDNTCASHSCSYSFSPPPSTTMVAELVGHVPHVRKDPWLFAECYMPGADSYHPFNPTAWGVPETTNPAELSQVGQYSYKDCQLACPCQGNCNQAVSTYGAPNVPPMSVPPMPVPGMYPYAPTYQAAPVGSPLITGCPAGGAPSQAMDASGPRCWYLSHAGDNCDSTCAANGCQYQYAPAPPGGDMVSTLIGHDPHGKMDPYLFLECYVPKEDKYHPAKPQQPEPAEAAQAGKKSDENCRLSCPCVCPTMPGWMPNSVPAPVRPSWSSPPMPVPSYSPAVGNPGGCTGIFKEDRCWYLSAKGDSCDTTCSSHGAGCSFVFSAPPATEMSPTLVGHEPSRRADPWLFAECYVDTDDRYHPYNPNAWGNPGKTPPAEMPEVGQFSYPSCYLSCPCQGTCTGAPLPFPVWGPQAGVTPWSPKGATPNAVPTPFEPLAVVPRPKGMPAGALNKKCDDGLGVKAVGRCWYLSKIGESCDTTCAARDQAYYFAAPEQDMVPVLLGYQPGTRQAPWLFVGCYVESEDRYHPYNPNAWGVPEKTPAAELHDAGQYHYDSCQLACPCAGDISANAVRPPSSD